MRRASRSHDSTQRLLLVATATGVAACDFIFNPFPREVPPPACTEGKCAGLSMSVVAGSLSELPGQAADLPGWGRPTAENLYDITVCRNGRCLPVVQVHGLWLQSNCVPIPGPDGDGGSSLGTCCAVGLEASAVPPTDAGRRGCGEERDLAKDALCITVELHSGTYPPTDGDRYELRVARQGRTVVDGVVPARFFTAPPFHGDCENRNGIECRNAKLHFPSPPTF